MRSHVILAVVIAGSVAFEAGAQQLPLPPILTPPPAARVQRPTPFALSPEPHRAIDSALALARREHKLVLLDFGGDWCVDCLVMDKFFRDTTVAPFLLAHFEIVRIDVGMFDTNLDISRKYGSPIDSGVPALVALAPTGTLLASTKNATVEDAQHLTANDILRLLQKWNLLNRGYAP